MKKNKTIIEKFRPNKIDDLILIEETKNLLRNMIKQEQCSHLLFTGSFGVGKTSTAKVLAKELNADLLAINACEVNLEEFRNNIKKFSSSLNIFYDKQVVLLDEADSLAPKIQKEMKVFLEKDCVNNCFIMTTNEVAKIDDALRSRCIEIDFDYELSEENSDELKELMFHRAKKNLTKEEKVFDENTLMNVINRFFPDLRRINNYLSVQF